MRQLACLILLAALPLSACGPSKEQVATDKAQIKATLDQYLPKLAVAYSASDLNGLKGYAAEKEIAAVRKRVEDIASQGRHLVPTFHSLAIEKIVVWGYANAYVTTVEVWDLKIYAAGTSTVLSQELGKSTRARYQLKKDHGHWLILFRTIVQS
ncbi:MAG TPA: IMS domain-containing protein [Thermoanaerobaculia bacterium]|nr:IMS domain-containing protein [Thermoanaerobaculia bacterium]